MLCCCDALEPLGPEEEYADTAAEIKDNGDSPDNKRRESERSLDTTVDTAPREATSEQLVSGTSLNCF